MSTLTAAQLTGLSTDTFNSCNDIYYADGELTSRWIQEFRLNILCEEMSAEVDSLDSKKLSLDELVSM